jgi:hypothetical protein
MDAELDFSCALALASKMRVSSASQASGTSPRNVSIFSDVILCLKVRLILQSCQTMPSFPCVTIILWSALSTEPQGIQETLQKHFFKMDPKVTEALCSKLEPTILKCTLLGYNCPSLEILTSR